MVSSQASEKVFRNRASDGEAIDKRVQLNKRLQQHDFSRWILELLRPVSGERVLEIGCGRGTQTIPVANAVGPKGLVSFLDSSRESVNYARSMIVGLTNANPLTGEMDDIDELLANDTARYDLIYSVYALYYARDPIAVLQTMLNRLSPGGRLCVVGPDTPHGLVELARQFHPIPAAVDESLRFRSIIVEPFFKSNFDNAEIHILKNPQHFSDPDQLIEFYRQTTYFEPSAQAEIRNHIAARMANGAEFVIDKFSYAVIAKKEI
ncbi:MAG: methyltransferase domain-containing protein [Actinomycetota bacterium]